MNKASSKITSCINCDKNNNIFCALSLEEQKELSKNKGNNFYKKGQTIFYEGNQSHGLYCIYQGKVKLSKLGESGKEQVLRLAKSKDVLGYRSIFSTEPYQATATALEDSFICHLSKEKFLTLMTLNPRLSWNTMQLLSKDLKNAEKHLINIAQKTVPQRIAEALLLLHTTFGFKEDKKSIDIKLTRSEISDIAGTTTETTIRTLAKMNKNGDIILKGKLIQIPDLKRLIIISGILD